MSIFPGIGETAEAALELARSGLLARSLLVSLGRVAWGLLFGLALGIPLGLASGASRLAELIFDRPLQMLRAVPFNALTPLLIIAFGVGEPMKVSLIVIGVFVPVYLNTRAGALAFDQKLLELARAYGMPKGIVAWELFFKGILPSILTGLRFALAIAWIALVTCEQVNAQAGIGYLLSRAQVFSRIDQQVVCIFLYAALGIATDGLVRLLEARLTRWREQAPSRKRGRGQFEQALIAAGAALAVLCGSCQKKEDPAAAGGVLRVAYLATANYLTLLSRDGSLAKELAKTGGRVEFIGPSAPFDAISIVGSGNADITSTGTGRFINFIGQGGQWVAFALEKYRGDSQGIVAAPGSGAASLQDLYGKKVGIGMRGSTGDYVLHAAFQWAGLDVSRVEKVELPDADYAAAFISGRIDALASYDQHYAGALAVPGARKLADGAEYGSLNWSIHIARKDFARDHPELLRAAYRALRDKAAAAAANPSLITDVYREFGASAAQIERIAGFAVPEILPMDAAAVEGLMKQAKQYEAFGFIPHAPDDFTPFVLDFSDAE